MNTYKTTEIAKLVGIHPNTVRFYEEMELIPKVHRQANGYRIFTDLHLEQFRLARIALRAEVIQNGLRKKALDIIKTSAAGDFPKAIELTVEYMRQIALEREHAEEAIKIASELLSGVKREENRLCLTRKETAEYLNITMDTLRNWEMNGLLTVKRKRNGYRVYTDSDIQRLKIIRSLRCANYSLSSILRMLSALTLDSGVDVRMIIDTPQEYEGMNNAADACDRLLTSLQMLERDAGIIFDKIKKMKKTFK